MDQQNGIEYEVLPDGIFKLSITCLRSEEKTIKKAVQQMTQECQENTYALHDRLSDLEDQEQAEIIEQTETIHVSVKTSIVRRKTRGVDP